jgi:endonuclease III related protein
MLRLPDAELAELIRPSGYFNQKAKKLKAFARFCLAKPDWSREALLALWGVGPETADSILLYAHRREAFVIDAYTLRIGTRLGWFEPGAEYHAAQAYLTASLPREPELYGEFHALLVELAKRHCRKTPECAGCPLRDRCRFARMRP